MWWSWLQWPWDEVQDPEIMGALSGFMLFVLLTALGFRRAAFILFRSLLGKISREIYLYTWIYIDKIPIIPLFARLNNPTSLSLFSNVRCSNPLIIIMSCDWICDHISCPGESRAGHRTPDMVSWVLKHLPWPAGDAFFFQCRPKCCKGTLLVHLQTAVHHVPKTIFSKHCFSDS